MSRAQTLVRKLASQLDTLALRLLYNPQTSYRYWARKGVRFRGTNIRLECTYLGTEPYLIEMGEWVAVGPGVQFLTHDGGVHVFREEHPGLQRFGTIVIRDHCMIGQNAMLLPGIEIGPRAIVAAGAVVTRSVPPGTIVAGVPAKVVSTVDSYRDRVLPTWSRMEIPAGAKEKRAFLEKLFWEQRFSEANSIAPDGRTDPPR